MNSVQKRSFFTAVFSCIRTRKNSVSGPFSRSGTKEKHVFLKLWNPTFSTIYLCNQLEHVHSFCKKQIFVELYLYEFANSFLPTRMRHCWISSSYTRATVSCSNVLTVSYLRIHIHLCYTRKTFLTTYNEVFLQKIFWFFKLLQGAMAAFSYFWSNTRCNELGKIS